MRSGSVVAPGPVTKLAMTRSSSESAKASIQPDATAGLDSELWEPASGQGAQNWGTRVYLTDIALMDGAAKAHGLMGRSRLLMRMPPEHSVPPE